MILAAGLALRLWYGWEWPDRSRFWDEGYALENVRSILAAGTLRPAKAYYPSPVFNLPPALVIGAVATRIEESEDLLFDPGTGRFGPWAYRICRALQALAGGLGLYMLYVLGKRLFGPAEGLLAAALMAFVPWHIHASGIFKPDALLVCGVLAALAAATALLERPDFRSALLVGAGVALAASAKLTGVLVAVPVGVSALWLWRRRLRRWWALVTAGAASALLFALANPYWPAYPHFVAGLERDYAMRARWQGMARWQVPGRFLDLLVGPTGLGTVAGTAAVVAYAWLVVRTVRRGAERSAARRAALAMTLSLPPIYGTVYAVQTAYFKPNNFLPLIPVFALALAAAVVAIGRRIERPVAALVLALAVLGPVLWLGWTYAHRSLVPSTRDAAVWFATSWKDPEGRLVAVVGVPRGSPPWEASARRDARAALVDVAATERAFESLPRFDAVVLPAGDRARDPLAGKVAADQVATFTSSPFALRGPPVTVVRHPWRRADATWLELFPCGGASCARTPAPAARRWVSLSILLGPDPGGSRPIPTLEVGSETIPLHPVKQSQRGLLLASERFRLGDGATPLRLVGSEPGSGDRLRLLQWRRPHKRRPSAQPS